MTALEKLIKLASTDASAMYRETAKAAEVQWKALQATGCQLAANVEKADSLLNDMGNACLDNMEGANGPEFEYQEKLMNAIIDVRMALGSPKPFPDGIPSCTPTDNVVK